MTTNSRSFGKLTFLPDIAGLYGFVTFTLLFIFDHGKSLIDGDTFWHIAAGERMLQTGTILTKDIYSHTALDKPWTAHEWLSEIVMAWLHQYTGITGTAIFFFLISALSFWLLFRIVSAMTGNWTAIVATSIALAFSMTHMLVRPHVFSWLFGIITLYALHKQGRWFWLLPPLTALWANLHGGFILGLALQSLTIAGTFLDELFSKGKADYSYLFQKIKRPAGFFGLSVLAAGINPFGFKLYLFPFEVTKGIFSSSITEWLPPNLQEEWLFRLFFLLILLLMSLKSSQTNWTDRLFVLFFFNASLTHQRYIGMASVFLCPYLARALKSLPWPKIKTSTMPTDQNQVKTSTVSGPIMTIILALGFIILAGSGSPGSRAVLDTFLPLPTASHPVEAIKYLNQTQLPGHMFNKYSWGGYLIYALNPSQKVFIDGRADMYGEEIFGDYQKIVSLDAEAEDLLKRHEIGWVIFSTDTALIRYLKTTGQWEETYADEVATILVRRNQLSNSYGIKQID